jgi:hypothetical protein
MNTAKLALVVSSFIAASAVVACSSAPPESVGSSEQHATADINHMEKQPDGSFAITCSDGTTQTATAAEITADTVCGGKAPAPVTECIGDTVPAPAAWKAPGAKQTVCTPADLQKLSDVAQTAQTWDDIKNPIVAQNAACASCIFSNDSDASWGPIVLATDGSGGGFVNWSSCFASVDGGSAACGQTYYEQSSCAESMCSSCQDDASVQNCDQEATSDVAKCGQYDLETACNGFATVNSACPDVFATIAVNCGGQ